MRTHYHVTSDPASTSVGGSSLGGLGAAFAGLCRPDLFGAVLSQSGAFDWKPVEESEHEWLARTVAISPKVPLRWYLDVGSLETRPRPDDGPSLVVANRHLRTVLQAKDYPVHYAEFGGGHDYLNWQDTLADGLLALVGSGSNMDERTVSS